MNTLLLTPPNLTPKAAISATFTGAINGFTLTASGVTGGTIEIGAILSDVPGFLATGTTVTQQLQGSLGLDGIYTVNPQNGRAQTVSPETMTAVTAAQAYGWDLTVDSSGNIAVATGAYALAQDVASACRTFLGELWYDVTFGVPYFQQILGQLPSFSFIKQKLIAVGMTVPGVGSVACYLTGPNAGRSVGGQLQITTTDGTLVVLNSQTLNDLWYVSGQ